MGGTLIDYEGFPQYWGDYYVPAFKQVSDQLNLHAAEEHIHAAAETLKTYNPRLYPREIEYQPAYIFADVFHGWRIADEMIDTAIAAFFAYFQQTVMIYPETISVIDYLHVKGYKIGILTDVPTGMPTEVLMQDIRAFEDKIDYFLTSTDCGYRKPNAKGIEIIAERFGVDVSKIAVVGNEKKDVAAAINAGTVSILINRESTTKDYGEDLRISQLTEIIHLMENE
ncbi:HAD family hydrolase [Paenibacillus lycopersici]|uniref:HAD family hydrolase n=1 Tax=Paenibacillus lycopersici TaxID=2704462 RepID=A0A6C0G332_9BACL|nr:HAD-IA family hydrolase [Paenibacillus lycopersici]QHT61030.1 HAD family hydrolase [Paenibacillus lycopersici]